MPKLKPKASSDKWPLKCYVKKGKAVHPHNHHNTIHKTLVVEKVA